MNSSHSFLTLRSKPDRLVCFGWTGNDKAARDAHISELAAHGVQPPSRIPIAVELSHYLLTHAAEITVTSDTTSGEVEFVLIATPDAVLVTVGSDHTDRDIERHSIPASKQVCAKCLPDAAWSLDEVAAHWNELILRSWVHQDSGRILYQESKVGAILSPQALLARAAPSPTGVTVLFCGTIPTVTGIVCGNRYDLELSDPVLGRSLIHTYSVRVMQQQL